MSDEREVWSFGYGANINIEFLKKSKKVLVIQHSPALLQGYKLVFNSLGFAYVEPGFAGLKKEEGGEVHGIAFSTDKEGEDKLDRQEGVGIYYSKQTVYLKAYDGRDIEAFIYVAINQTNEEFLPSARYLGIICQGARQAELDPEYISQLAAQPVYRAENYPEVLQARERRDKEKLQLRHISKQELSQHKTEDVWVSCLGFVVRVEGAFIWYLNHRGRDITSLLLMKLHGISPSMDQQDDGGDLEYPLVHSLTEEEVEYVRSWLDHYHIRKPGHYNQIVGLHKEFKEQQEYGSTTFVLPPVM